MRLPVELKRDSKPILKRSKVKLTDADIEYIENRLSENGYIPIDDHTEKPSLGTGVCS